MGKHRIQRVASKWTKAKLCMNDRNLTSYHPMTKRMSKHNLKSMLSKYRMVFIKPIYGSHGHGVMRLDQMKKHTYRIQSGSSKKGYAHFSNFYRSIQAKTGKKPYMVQKGIHLLKYHHRLFDIRVMVQKNHHNHWEVSGMLCRVAHPQKIVTNVLRGGMVMPVANLLKPYASRSKQKHLEHLLKRLGMQTAKLFERRYPGVKELGLDVAIDKHLKPWILEVNTKPDLWLFFQLRDRRMYYRIIRNAKVYGRVK